MFDNVNTKLNPKHTPPLETQFQPAVLASHHYINEVKASGQALPLVIALERGGAVSTYETLVSEDDLSWLRYSQHHLERLVKFLLWSRGASRLYIAGSAKLAEYIRRIYAPDGERGFDYRVMSRVYGVPFEVISCGLDETPPEHESTRALGRHLDGCRVGFDLGASDVKVSALIDGVPVFSTEMEWQPRDNPDPEYHKAFIRKVINLAASKLPRLDAIGGSAAGIYIDNQPKLASLFRAVPEDAYDRVRHLFNDLEKEFGVPLQVINDGEVTALAGSMSLEDNGVLGIAMGSSEAAGFVNMKGNITDHLNELAFAPIDYNPNAPIDEWSGDRGTGASYFSQAAVFRLAAKIGIVIPQELSPAQRLCFVQEQLEDGHQGAVKIWESMGVYLGYALAHYADFYDFKHVLIMGRCSSGSGGELMLDKANQVLKDEFPELADKAQVQLPDEKSRRVGQSIAAASLPVIER